MTDRLYELSRRFYLAKPWGKISPADLFAIPLSGGRTGYVCVSGDMSLAEGLDVIDQKDVMQGLSLFVGLEDLNIMRRHLLVDYPDMGDSELERRRLLLFFVSADELKNHDIEYQAIRKYEKKAGRKFAKHGLPVFVSEEPYRLGNSYLTPTQEDDLAMAMSYTLEMLTELKTSDKDSLGLVPFDIEGKGQDIARIEEKNGLYQISKERIPPLTQPEYPPVIAQDEILLKSLSKRKKKGTLLCQLGGCMTSYEDHQDNYFPMMIFAVMDHNSEDPVCDAKAYDYDQHPENLLTLFLQSLKTAKRMPAKFVARDARTAAFLTDAAAKLGCGLEIEQDLPVLDEAVEYYMEEQEQEEDEWNPENMSPDEMATMVQMMADLPDDLFDKLLRSTPVPAGMLDEMRTMLALHMLPDNLQEAMTALMDRLDEHGHREDAGNEKILDFRSAVSAKKTAQQNLDMTVNGTAANNNISGNSSHSYIVSVSLVTGCYRHLQVPTDIRMDKLADEILSAFDFDHDHMYSFYMDNTVSSSAAEYTGPSGSPETAFWAAGTPADKATLEGAKRRADGKFLFVYDFGDNWCFNCRILREIDEPTETVKVVRSKGEAPKQYS